MADFTNILSHNEEQLTEKELLNYLNDHLSEEEKCCIEKKIAGDPFDADALEGLSKIENKESLKKQVTQLNKKLQQQLTAKRQRKEKIKINIFKWIVLAILILLFICIISYVIITLQNRSNAHTQMFRLAILFS